MLSQDATPSLIAHDRLVSEPSPRSSHNGTGELGCGLPIVTSRTLLPYLGLFLLATIRFHAPLGSTSFRGFPQFDRVAGDVFPH